MIKQIKYAVAAGMVLGLGACAETMRDSWDFMRGHIKGHASVLDQWQPSTDAVQRGAMQFAFGDYGGLNSDAMDTVAVPWKLTAAALVLHQRPDDLSQDSLRAILTGYGFFYPQEIANWPEGGAAPRPEAAMGIVLGTGARTIPAVEVQIASTGCAACHSAPVYNPDGLPDTGRVWLGAPNPSLDLQSYTLALHEALKQAAPDRPRLMATVRRLYPDVSERELRTLENFVLPLVDKRLAQIAKTGQVLPFHNGHAGVTNGVAALKMQHAMLDGDKQAFERERGFTSIPHLSDRLWRSSLLWDGAYAPASARERQREITRADLTNEHAADLAGITAYFTVPTMGMTGEAAVRAIPSVVEAFGFVGQVRPQPYPAPIDGAAAQRGSSLFAARCSSCHGQYSDSITGPELVSFPNWLGNVGTDLVRAEAIDRALADKVNRSSIRHYIRAEATGVYAAPPLTGIWQSAPYLHNGSVPSLAALLGLEPRPAHFRVGGHAMDWRTVGISYPQGFEPYSRASSVDTGERGMGNQGHTRMFDGLTDTEKRDLLEYLKRL